MPVHKNMCSQEDIAQQSCTYIGITHYTYSTLFKYNKIEYLILKGNKYILILEMKDRRRKEKNEEEQLI